MHEEMPMGDMGSFGGRQYAEFQRNANDGYGVEIPHGQSAAFNVAETMYVDNSLAARGPDFVESTGDSGITGSRSRPRSDNNNVADTSVPPVMRTRGR